MHQAVQKNAAAQDTQQAQRTLRLIRLPQVMDKTGMGRSWIYQAVKDGRFPAPISIEGTRATAWLEGSVDRWIEDHIAKSKAA